MASLSHQFLSLSPPSKFPSKSNSFTQSLFFPFHNTHNNGPRLFISQLRGRHFKASVKVAETDPKTINEDEQQDNDQQQELPSMSLLIQSYKKAILDEDEESISEIESAICLIEVEKNALSSKVGEMTAQVMSGKNKFLRLKADLENYRKRIEKDHSNLTSNAQGNVIESLLPLVDSFEKAKQHSKPETENEKKIDTSYQGIYKQFVEIMRSLRVSAVGTVGKPFDPSIHEAIAREESQNIKAGIVIEEVRRGFILGDRLLRPAQVKVSSGPRKAPQTTEASSDPDDMQVESSYS